MQIVDFAIVCALDAEYKTISRCFANSEPTQFAGHNCSFIRFNNDKSNKSYRLIIVKIDKMGNLASLNLCSDLIRQLSPRHIILVGICGGLLSSVEDFRLGDVVVSDRVIYYEPAKILAGTYESRSHTYESKSDPSLKLLRSALNIGDGSWTALKRINNKRPNDSNARERPKLIHGIVCSGEKVIASDSRSKEMSCEYPDAVSIEMEAAGVAYACLASCTDFLVVKAVSDSAGCAKNDEYRDYACATAASFVHCLLTEADLPPLTPRCQLTIPLGDLFRLQAGEEVGIILPSYENQRHKNANVLNYPYNPFESAFDDVYCAFRIISALESICGRDKIYYNFDQERDIPDIPNKIILGSTISNMFTHDVLRNLYFRFGSGEQDHDIIGPEGLKFTASYHATLHEGVRVLDTDFALITVVRKKTNSFVVLAGCRAYGQLFLGDFLSNAQQTDELVQIVPDGDFQCVLRVDVTGRQYRYGGIERVVVRTGDNTWQQIR